VRSTPAQIQAFDRRPIACPVKQRPHGEELIEGKFAVEDVSAREAVGFLEILGRDDLVAQDGLRRFGAYCAIVFTTVSPSAFR